MWFETAPVVEKQEVTPQYVRAELMHSSKSSGK